MDDNRDGGFSYGSTLMVFLLGAAVGATVAVLYAPMAGQETRTQIAEKAGQFKDKAVEIKDQVAEKASRLKETAAARLHGAAHESADALESASATIRSEADRVGESAT